MKYACLICGRISNTRRCERHGGTNDRPTFTQRGYRKEFAKNRAKVLADQPVCCVDGCTAPAVVAHHDPPRRMLVAMGATNPDGVEWLRGRAMCIPHHNMTAARGR